MRSLDFFFYLFVCFDCRQVSSNDYSSLDTLTKTIVKEKQPFIRLELSKEDLLEMFKVLLTVCLFFISVNLSWKTDCSIYFENRWKCLNFRTPFSKSWKYLKLVFSPWKPLIFIEQDQKVFSVYNLGRNLVLLILLLGCPPILDWIYYLLRY